MTSATTKRGRPKGTGLNDTHYLKAIAALILKSDGEMKPTTAIKSLGISNPSTIRRLRDKFNSEREDLLTENVNNNGAEKPNKNRENSLIDPVISQRPSIVSRAMSTSAATTETRALNKPKDPKITEKSAKKKIKQKKKEKSKKANSNNSPKPITKTANDNPQPQQMNRNRPALNVIGATPMGLVGAWMSLSAHAIAATAQTQLEMIEIAQTSPWYREARQLQQRAFDTWLRALTPAATLEQALKPIKA